MLAGDPGWYSYKSVMTRLIQKGLICFFFVIFLILRSVSDDSLRRYVFHASENCIQELLSAACDTESSRGEWKVVAVENGVELSKCRSGSNQTFRNGRVMKATTRHMFVAKDIDATKFFHAWDADLVEARCIKGLEENLSICLLRFGERSKPLFRNREFIVYQRRKTMNDGILLDPAGWLPKVACEPFSDRIWDDY